MYNHLKRLLSAALETPFTERQICSLHYQHEDQEYDVDVGQSHPVNGEIIVAILEGTLPPAITCALAHVGSSKASPFSSTPLTCSPSLSLSRHSGVRPLKACKLGFQPSVSDTLA